MSSVMYSSYKWIEEVSETAIKYLQLHLLGQEFLGIKVTFGLAEACLASVRPRL
jgi:hypothetical protein